MISVSLRNTGKNEQIVALCRALGDNARVKIIKLLADGEMCVCEIIEEVELSQAAISHHLKILKQAGLINVRHEGRWRHYSLDKSTFLQFQNLLNTAIFNIVTRSL